MCKKTFSAVSLIVVMLVFFSDSYGASPRMEAADAISPSGTYRVILHGNNYLNDLRTAVFLDREDDKTVLSPFTPDFEYRVVTGVPADKALAAAEQFLRSNPSVNGIFIGRIVEQGETLGYEIRPRYRPLEFGTEDPLDIGYQQKGGEVRVIIRLIPSLEHGQSGPDNRDGGR